MKKLFFLITVCLMVSCISYAQNSIKGVVTEVHGMPLSGVGIFFNGKAIGVTDSVGRFFLRLNAEQTLLKFRVRNYAETDTLLKAPFNDLLVIVMNESSVRLDDVEINTGYQVLPKERQTGSFSVLSAKDLNQQVSTDFIGRLEGNISSLLVDRKTNAGSGYGIMIRGLSTLNGPRSPLIVVDNFPYEGDLDNINPNDIEQVTVLKDAAAASIWGARAGNGVIIVTTKKAKFNQPLKIGFNAALSLAMKPDLFYLDQISSSDFIDVELMLFDKGYYLSQESSPSKVALSDVVELKIAERDGKITSSKALSQINFLRGKDLRKDFDKLMYQVSANQQYNLQLANGSDKISWLASVGYDDNRDQSDASYKRLNLHIGHNFRLTKRLTLSSELNLSSSNSTPGKPTYGSLPPSNGDLPPYTAIADQNGNAIPVIQAYRQTYLKQLESTNLLDWYFYPLTDYQSIDAKRSLINLTAAINGSYIISDGLKISVKYQYQKQRTENLVNYNEQAYLTRDLINAFSQIDVLGNVKRIIPQGGIRDFSSLDLSGYNARAQIDYGKRINRHEINLIAGAEVRDLRTEGATSRNYGIDHNTMTLAQVDYQNPYKNFVTGVNNFIPDKNGISGTTNRFVSLFTNFAYTFNERYVISLSGRRDASNLFGVKTNDQWNPLFSAGLAWNTSNENFYKSSVIPYLKFRTTFGVSGNTDQGRTAITTIRYFSTNSPYTQSPYAVFNNYANPQLKWERVYMFNAGVDFGLKDNIFRGSIEFYHKKAVDLYGNSPLDYTGGIGSSITKNVAIIQTEGVDIDLVSQNISGKFNWSTSILLSFNNDKVIKNYNTSVQGSNFLNGGSNVTGLEGMPVYSLLSYQFAGLDPKNGNPLGYVNGVSSSDYAALTGARVLSGDLKFHGAAIPTMTMALGNKFSFQKWSLDFRFMVKQGYYFRKQTINYSSLYTSRWGHSDFELRWKVPGDEDITNVPSMIYPSPTSRDSFYTNSEATVLKGDNIRLQYINLAYRLAIKKAKFKQVLNIDLFFVANNLGIIWTANKYGLDPDFQGIPIPKTFSFGFRSNF